MLSTEDALKQLRPLRFSLMPQIYDALEAVKSEFCIEVVEIRRMRVECPVESSGSRFVKMPHRRMKTEGQQAVMLQIDGDKGQLIVDGGVGGGGGRGLGGGVSPNC